MPDDPALIWEKEPGRRARPSAAATPSDPVPPATPPKAPVGERISLREAHHRFGVAVSTLRSWARAGKVEAVLEHGRWMVAPASIAAHLSARRRADHRRRASPVAESSAARSGPTDAGTAMLVPRDAWDKLMDQLGNLHEAGQQLAAARERAAKAETEARFLRERLGELRSERDRLLERVDSPAASPGGPTGGFLGRLLRGLRGPR